MHSFIRAIAQWFSQAVPPALAGAAIGVLITILLYIKGRKSGQKFSLLQGTALALLFCYLGGLTAVTLLIRMGGGTFLQLHPFRAFREAWNSFTLQSWLNPLLNIAMFAPLGALLPLAASPFRRWYWTLAAGLGCSLLVETLQYLLQRGSADVDDLLCNTLGTMLGFSLCLILVCLAKRQWMGAGIYAILPAGFAAALAGVFIAYQVQPYGNLADAPAFTANTRGTTWVLECQLSDQPGPSGVYWAEPFDKDSCDAFAVEFVRRLGGEIDFNRDVDYYDNTTVYSDHSTYSLWVDHNDRSYKYTDFRVDTSLWSTSGTMTEEALRAALEQLGIDVPDAAQFLVPDKEQGTYILQANRVEENGTITDGMLTCRVVEGGFLFEVDSTLSVSTLYGSAAVISEQDAYEQLCRGQFSDGDLFEYYAPQELHVTACELQYLIDTKGFRQPVYFFSLAELETAVFVPALAG